MHIITMLLLLSVLILVHELGHFGVARKLGIKVDTFGFGLPFGPTLYETTWGETKIRIHAFLLGGYVSFPDDDPESKLAKDDIGRISNRPVWQRFLVVSAGVFANAVLAYLIVLFVAGFSGSIPSGKFTVYSAGIQPDKTLSAHKINIKEGDKIVSVNNVLIDSPMKFIAIAKRSKKFDNFATQEKIDSQIKMLQTLNPELAGKISPKNVIPKNTKTILPKISAEEPIKLENYSYSDKKEYQPLGKELSATQQTLRNNIENKNSYTADGSVTLYDLAAATADTAHPINILVERNNKEIALPTAYSNKDGIIGVKLKAEEISVPTKGLIPAVTGSWGYIYRNTSLMVDGLAKIITGQIPLRDMHGIVAITKVGSDIITHRGIFDGLLLTALISMDLAIVNLLPIPALDGGHILFLLIEKIKGRPVKQETQEFLAKYGFMLLIGLMIFIVINDIFALVTDKL